MYVNSREAYDGILANSAVRRGLETSRANSILSRIPMRYGFRPLLLAACLLSAHSLHAGPIAPAVTFPDFDLAKTKLTVDGQSVPVDADALKTLFALPDAPKVLRTSVRNTKSKWQLVVVFREPIAVGTQMLMSVGRSQPAASVLREEFRGEPANAADADWVRIPALHVFAPGARVRAMRLAGSGEQPDAQHIRWALIAPRFGSVTAEAVGSGEKGPFGSHPNAIPNGKTWVNAAPDPGPGALKQIPRAAISDVIPSWYILSWDSPKTLRGLWLSSNAEQVAFSIYRGDPRQNPALAGPRDWEKVTAEAALEVIDDNHIDRFVGLPSVTTLAVRVDITSVRKGGAAAEIRRFDAISDLGDKPLQVRSGPALFGISYEQPFDGQAAMVITDAAGRPVRNLVAQVDRKQGPVLEPWDLKDDAGRTVPAGEYRWKVITAPPLGLEYQFTVTPNVTQHHSDRVPWLTTESGPNGWLADHSSSSSGAAWGNRVYFGAPVAESGVSLIECDLDGKKLWAKHGFGPFVGVSRLAADKSAVYVLAKDSLERLDPTDHSFKPLGKITRDGRAGQVVGMTAAADRIYLAMQAPVPFMDNALRSSEVDLDNCWPRYPEKVPEIGGRRVSPNPRLEFLRLLRLTGTPSGQGDVRPNEREPLFPIDLETSGDARGQFVLVAFKSPVPLGSVVFPCPGPEFKVELAALKDGAKYPPDPRDEAAWKSFPTQPVAGWTCAAAPPQTRTRALRLKVTRAGDAAADPLDDLLDKEKPGAKDLPSIDSAGKKTGTSVVPVKDWFVRIEGMRILRRRLAPLTEKLAVRVSSGEIKAGVWDAKRTEPITAENPGVYLMEWPAAQSVAGLAIKEIDGAETEIDVWDGPAAGPVPLGDSEHWRTVATYTQARRDSYEPAFNRNDCARYIDGVVDFGQEINTRAVRLRVVKQWADNSHGSGDRQTASQRRDRGGKTLDPRRCIVFGVAALRYLGDEPEVDRIAYQRIEVRDGRTGEVVKEIPVAINGGLAAGPDGTLFGLQAGRVVNIDPATGAATPLLPNVEASRIAVGPDGLIYVFVKSDRVVRAYRANGELVRTFGKPGGQSPGPWDPEKFLGAHVLVPDSRGGLWVVENQDVPRRIVQFNPDGSFAREHLGNTHYGGGGVLDRFDKARLFHGNTQFELDWNTGNTRIKNLLAERMPENLVPVRHRDRTYLASAPLSHSVTQPVAQVYLLDEAAGRAKSVAAFGDAGQFNALKTPALLARLAPGKVPGDYTFLWADRNADGKPDADEVQFDLKTAETKRVQLGRFNEAFQCRGGFDLYEAKEVLANGTPVFTRTRTSAAGLYGLNDGRVLDMNVPVPDSHVRHSNSGGRGGHNETVVRNADGSKAWSYPTEHPGVSGLWLPPWEPGYVSNEFNVIGHEVEAKGDLGEFFVTDANNGMWKVWTADGFLASTILRHKFDRQSKTMSSFTEAPRGTRFDGLSASQEHFHGFFTKSDSDGKYYIVHGHNLIAITEVLGLDRFRRLGGAITVTAADVQQVREYEAERARREVKSQARVMECLPIANVGAKDGVELEDARFAIGHDAQSLFLRWTLDSELKNTGTDFHRYFKTGASVEVQLGTDPAADPGRRLPVKGDVRLLITVVGGKPEVVLYQPVAPGASPGEHWETRTDAAGTTSFDRVVRLSDVRVLIKKREQGGCVLEALVPLRTLGITPTPGLRLGFDWGVQTSDDGNSVKRRQYWSNQLANGTSDEATEARIEPSLWGTLVFANQSAAARKISEALPGLSDTPKSTTDVDDLLKSLDPKKKGSSPK